jgi:hypothetical protein
MTRSRALLAMLSVILAVTLSGCVPSAAAVGVKAPQSATTTVQASQLADKYGLRVNLLAVTAAGGMVDLRLKVLDAAKAAQLVGKHAPVLQVEGTGTVLSAPEDAARPEVKPADGQTLLVLYPNIQNAVKPGMRVAVMFGDTRLEPVTVQ